MNFRIWRGPLVHWISPIVFRDTPRSVTVTEPARTIPGRVSWMLQIVLQMPTQVRRRSTKFRPSSPMTHDVTRVHRARTAVVCMNIRSKRATEIRNVPEPKTTMARIDVLFVILKMPNGPKADHPIDEHRCRNHDAGPAPIPAIRETRSPIEDPAMPPMHKRTVAGRTLPAVLAAAQILKTKIGMMRTAKMKSARSKKKTEICRRLGTGTRASSC